MRVLALVGALDHVCYRYRIEAFAWAMAEHGLLLEAVPLDRNLWRRIRQLRRVGRADVVILQRKLLPLHQLQVLRRAAKRLIYDVDDAVFQRESYSSKSSASWQRMILFWATIHAADAVIAGNEYLRQRTARYIEPQRVHMVPTCVEPERYNPIRHQRMGAAARLVWIGQRSTLPSLDRCRPHLATAAQTLPGLQLRVICDRYPTLPEVRVVPRPWSTLTEANELCEGDIGINWLPDDQWSRGKCGLKVLQYMSAGLPVVANPVGMNCEMVLHGQTGILASTPEEWAAAIGRLAADPQLRRRMGEAGRRLVQERFGVSRWSGPFARLVRCVAEQTPFSTDIKVRPASARPASELPMGVVRDEPCAVGHTMATEASTGQT
jgi:glycosyltransferase involved in cell wall biosynthesis